MHTFRYRRSENFRLLNLSFATCSAIYIVGIAHEKFHMFNFPHPSDPMKVFNGKNFPDLQYSLVWVWDICTIIIYYCIRCAGEDVAFFWVCLAVSKWKQAYKSTRFDYSIAHLNLRLVWKSNLNSSDNYYNPTPSRTYCITNYQLVYTAVGCYIEFRYLFHPHGQPGQ